MTAVAAARTTSAPVVDESRLASSPARPGHVPRPALSRRLRVAPEPVLTVIAPPGYGKTTAIVDWSERDPRAFSWLWVEESHNDPIVFATYLAVALDHAGAGCSGVFGALEHGRSVTAVLPLLCAAASSVRNAVIVVDDAHLLTHDRCTDVLLAVREGLDAGSKLVLAGRRSTELVETFRSRWETFDVHDDNLRLGPGEALGVLRAAGVDATESEAAELNNRVEGWAAGVSLAAVVARSSGSALDGVDRVIAEYLRLEVLRDLQASDLEFLRRLSPLEPISGPLADAVLGVCDSAEKLAALARANLLLFSLPVGNDADGVRRYRMHRLLREHLAAEEERYEPEQARAIYRRASDWFEDAATRDAGDAELQRAIEYAYAARDSARVLELLDEGRPRAYGLAALEAHARWFGLLDPEALCEHPDVAWIAARTHALLGNAVLADRFAAIGETSPCDAFGELARANLCRHGLAAMAGSVQAALEVAPFHGWHGEALFLDGIVANLSGDPERAESRFREILDLAAVEVPTLRISALAQCAALAASRGDWAEASELARDAYDLMREWRFDDYPPMALVCAVGARVAAHAGDRLRADELLDRAGRLLPCVNEAIPWLAIQVRLELGRAHLILGEVEATAKLVTEIEVMLATRGDLEASAAEVRELRADLSGRCAPDSGWPASITRAERKLLPLLATHLTFREIADELHISRNTVKTQAISVYRKLQVSSRGEAIEAATGIGLLQ